MTDFDWDDDLDDHDCPPMWLGCLALVLLGSLATVVALVAMLLVQES